MRLKTQVQAAPAPANHNTRVSRHESNLVAKNLVGDAEYSALAARATNDAIRDWDVKNGRLEWPEGLTTLLGHTPSVISQEIGFWQRHVHPDDRARTAASIRDALTSDERWSGEYRFRRADGSYILLLERALIVRNEKGEAIRFVGSMMDITARKELQDQLVRSQKMEAFGQLAGGVAHDFNNFLTTILGYSDILLNSGAVKGQVAKHLVEIQAAAQRAGALTGQLLAFSRRHPLAERVFEANTFVTNLERSLLPLLGEDIHVQCDLHRFRNGGGYIKVDPEQMKQIILNLAVNARDAMPNGGRLKIATGSLRIRGDAKPNGSDELAPGEYVTLSVTDDGIGMSGEVKARLFEPFFTTKEVEHRSGLGLATSYGIVRQSGGHIGVKSELGAGTTMTIYLPKVPAPAPAGYKSPKRNETPTGNETILVLEDDIAVRHLSVRLLRTLGYEVIEAANGDDAQRIIREFGENRIDLLLTDIVMPRMSGHHFADWLRKTSPNTKVIFISGYLDESIRATEPNDATMFFLPKPFGAPQLAQKVREALDAVDG